jgi:hypothetical protein
MGNIVSEKSRLKKHIFVPLLLFGMLLARAMTGLADDRSKPETIDATAMGTGTQMGRVVSITVRIYDYSTPDERQTLVQAFIKGQNQGLVNALTKMRAVGRISITGTLGYDLSYVKMLLTPTGRKIRFITNRQLRFGELYWDTQSVAYNLTAGELELNNTDNSKSSGVLYPAAQLVINKDGDLQFELRQNPWNLVNIVDWKRNPAVE